MDAPFGQAGRKLQEATVNGYIIVQDAGGLFSHISADHTTRAHLIEMLLDSTPESSHILGLVLGPASNDRPLRLVG